MSSAFKISANFRHYMIKNINDFFFVRSVYSSQVIMDSLLYIRKMLRMRPWEAFSETELLKIRALNF